MTINPDHPSIRPSVAACSVCTRYTTPHGWLLDDEGVAAVIEVCPSLLTHRAADVTGAFQDFRDTVGGKRPGIGFLVCVWELGVFGVFLRMHAIPFSYTRSRCRNCSSNRNLKRRSLVVNSCHTLVREVHASIVCRQPIVSSRSLHRSFLYLYS